MSNTNIVPVHAINLKSFYKDNKIHIRSYVFYAEALPIGGVLMYDKDFSHYKIIEHQIVSKCLNKSAQTSQEGESYDFNEVRKLLNQSETFFSINHLQSLLSKDVSVSTRLEFWRSKYHTNHLGEKYYINKYYTILNKLRHILRESYALWENDTSKYERIFEYLISEERFQARLRFIFVDHLLLRPSLKKDDLQTLNVLAKQLIGDYSKNNIDPKLIYDQPTIHDATIVFDRTTDEHFFLSNLKSELAFIQRY